MPGQDFPRKPVMGDVLRIRSGDIGQTILRTIGGVSAGAYQIGQQTIGFLDGSSRIIDEQRLTCTPLSAKSLAVRHTEGPDLQVPDMSFAPGQLGFRLMPVTEFDQRPFIFNTE